MLIAFLSAVVDKLSKQIPISVNMRFQNCWEEFCWHQQGDSDQLGLWIEYLEDVVQTLLYDLTEEEYNLLTHRFENNKQNLKEFLIYELRCKANDYELND